jgi:hypothetical protein
MSDIRPIDMAKQVSQYQFEAIMEAFNTITEWLAKDFPEVDFTVEFNDDSQNPVDPAFRIKTRLITDKSMDQDDQFLRKNELVIRTAMWEDSILMSKWTAMLVPSFKKNISDQINNWYARKKVEGTAL